jgi:hypothetical protein
MARTPLFFIALLTLASCSSRQWALDSQDEKSAGRTIAVFSEPQNTGRCFSVIEPESSQFVSIDLASALESNRIHNLEDCTQASKRGKAAVGSYVSNMSRVASHGMAPVDHFEFNPSQWPVEYHYNNRIYHIYRGKVVSVESQ